MYESLIKNKNMFYVIEFCGILLDFFILVSLSSYYYANNYAQTINKFLFSFQNVSLIDKLVFYQIIYSLVKILFLLAMGIFLFYLGKRTQNSDLLTKQGMIKFWLTAYCSLILVIFLSTITNNGLTFLYFSIMYLSEGAYAAFDPSLVSIWLLIDIIPIITLWYIFASLNEWKSHNKVSN